MVSKYAGKCSRCGHRFPAGTVIAWAKGAGASHANPADCPTTPPPPVAAPVAIDLAPLAGFLYAAKGRGLQNPKARFLAPGGRELVLSIAGAMSKAPGSIQVVLDGTWIGRVEPDGKVVGRVLASDPAVQQTLLQIACNPAEAAKAYGALTCRCSFCGLALTDAGSVEVGYGPVCAKKWGLPHQPKGTPDLAAVPVTLPLSATA